MQLSTQQYLTTTIISQILHPPCLLAFITRNLHHAASALNPLPSEEFEPYHFSLKSVADGSSGQSGLVFESN